MFVDYEDVNVIEGKRPDLKKEPEKKVAYKEFKPSEQVHLNRSFALDIDEFFKEDDYAYSLNFYDFEVFMGDWLVVIVNPIEKVKRIIANDVNALSLYYEEHKHQIWVGYNSRNYDVYILKSILLGMNPKEVSDMIILRGMKGWQISDEFKDMPLLNYDVSMRMLGLKQLEGFMGNDIRETTVPFNLCRPLNKPEMMETVKYCMHDVEQTIEVFKKTISEYNAQMDLISTFRLPLSAVNKTKAQLTAEVIGCEKADRDDEFDIQIVDCLKIDRYKHVLHWFLDRKNYDYRRSLEADVCGVPHVFGWGGLHGCPADPVHIKGRLFHVDVTSYYPSIMIEYDFLTRNCRDKRKFKEVYDKRVELKRAGKKKEQAPYKVILNSTFGICKDRYSKAYDPRQANNVCINGQLMLLDLLEHLEGCADIIQSNTDGIILQVEDSDEAVRRMRNVCQEWMDRTKMGLGFDEISEIWQKDVNNYIFKFTGGKLERKGAYVKELDELDFDLPIVNEAIVKYLVDGVEPRETIAQCGELKMFQKIVKVNGSYLYGWHNNEFLTDRTFRVFAGKDRKDTYIGRCKTRDGTIEKFANTPDCCFIWNESVNGAGVPDKLDRRWYVELAEKRIEDFGISMKKGMLF